MRHPSPPGQGSERERVSVARRRGPAGRSTTTVPTTAVPRQPSSPRGRARGRRRRRTGTRQQACGITRPARKGFFTLRSACGCAGRAGSFGTARFEDPPRLESGSQIRLRIARLRRRCGPPRRIPPGAVAPGAVPFGTVAHSAGQGLAPGATALKRTDGGTARATRTDGRRHRPRYPDLRRKLLISANRCSLEMPTFDTQTSVPP